MLKIVFQVMTRTNMPKESLKRGELKLLYVMPDPGVKGGMAAISNMYYEAGLFNKVNFRHFSSSINPQKTFPVKIFLSIYLKVTFFFQLKKFKPDVVYIMSSSYWGYYDKCLYTWIAKLTGSKTMLNLVGGGFSEFYESSYLHRFLVTHTISIPDCLIIFSSYWENYFSANFPTLRIQDIPNPVAARIFEAGLSIKNKSIFKIVTVSAMVKSKGIEELARVIKDVCALSEDITFTLIGDGEKLSWVRNELATLTGKGQVTIPGFVSEKEKIMELTSANLFILLTHFEVLPISILEAMSAALPVISTNVQGIPDVIKDGRNGFLFNVGDTESVTNKILAVSQERDLLKRMGNTNQKLIMTEYDVEIILKKHVQLAERIVH